MNPTCPMPVPVFSFAWIAIKKKKTVREAVNDRLRRRALGGIAVLHGKWGIVG